MKSGFETWLNTPEGSATILECARTVQQQARRSSINLAQIFREEFVDDSQELRHIIASELTAYLLEHHTVVAQDIADDLRIGDISAITAKITTKFMNHLLDQRRTYHISPFHAYLRHLRKVISQATNVRYLPTDSGSFFAYSTDDSLVFLPHAWCGLPFDGWPSPSLPLSEIEKQAGMIHLSRFYWDEATCRYETEYLQPLRELTRFVFAKYTVVARRQDMATGCDSGLSESEAFDLLQTVNLAGDPLGPRQRQSERLDYDIIETELSRLAGHCLAGLDERQREMLWRASEGEKLDDIGQLLGEKGASTIHYQLKKARNHILKFWSLWGNAQLPGFAEEDEEEQFIFLEKIVHLCKERNGGRETL